jgi:hypothetical protein
METKAKTKRKPKQLKKLNTNSFTLDLSDFELGVSKEITPYKCNACEAVFKRLSGYAIHNRYYANKGKCPQDKDLVLLNLKQIQHKANGNQYQCWEVIPATKPTGIKDELLLEMENIAFPNFNANIK